MFTFNVKSKKPPRSSFFKKFGKFAPNSPSDFKVNNLVNNFYKTFYFSSTLKQSNVSESAASPSTSSQCSSGVNTTSGYSTNDGCGTTRKKSISSEFFQNLRIKKLKKTFSVAAASGSTIIKSPDTGVVPATPPNLSDNERMTPTKLTFAPDTKEKTKRQNYRSRSKTEKKKNGGTQNASVDFEFNLGTLFFL